MRGWLVPLMRRISSLAKGWPDFTMAPLELPFKTASKLFSRKPAAAASPEWHITHLSSSIGLISLYVGSVSACTVVAVRNNRAQPVLVVINKTIQ